VAFIVERDDVRDYVVGYELTSSVFVRASPLIAPVTCSSAIEGRPRIANDFDLIIVGRSIVDVSCGPKVETQAVKGRRQ
jgi:hypothetical protein